MPKMANPIADSHDKNNPQAADPVPIERGMNM